MPMHDPAHVSGPMRPQGVGLAARFDVVDGEARQTADGDMVVRHAAVEVQQDRLRLGLDHRHVRSCAGEGPDILDRVPEG